MLVGAGLYAVFVAVQAFQSLDMLISDFVFTIPVSALLALGILFALRRKGGNRPAGASYG